MGFLVESQRVRRGHRFYPEAWQWAGIPGLLGQDGLGDRAIVFLHYFVAGCDWWVSEVDAATGEAFGWADLGCGEFGYICLPELEAVTVGGLVVERDLDWAPVPLWQALGRGTAAQPPDGGSAVMSGAPARHAGDPPDTRASLGLVIEAMLDLLDVHSPVQRCALRAMLWQCGAPERAAMLHGAQGSGGWAAGGGDPAAMVVHVEYGRVWVHRMDSGEVVSRHDLARGQTVAQVVHELGYRITGDATVTTDCAGRVEFFV